MFYAHYVLAKKGPLARIWLAAHWDKKLTKAHVFETNIEKSVDGILQPKVKMALRTSGHLLLGVVRIYSRKAKYLLADCNEAFVKIKMAFRPGMVDLPEDNREAAINAITLPEVFHDFDTAMPELNDVDIEAQLTLNQSRAEEITLREDYGNMSSLVEQEEGFGDMGFGADGPDILRHASRLEQSLDQANLLFSEGVDQLEKEKEPQPSTSAGVIDRPQLDIDPVSDGFPANLTNDIMDGGLFEGGLFDDAPMQVAPVEESVPVVPTPLHQSEDDDDDDRYGGHPSPSHSSVAGGLSPDRGAVSCGGLEEPSQVLPPQSIEPEVEPSVPELPPPATPNPPPEQTLLLHNDEETFALGPVDASALRGSTKTKRKRKLIVDEVKNISGEEMKSQLSDTSDIVTSLDLAPPTKRLMHWKETGGVEKLFALPGRNIPARFLFKTYQRHLTSRAVPNEEGVPEADPMLLEGEPQDQPGTLAASRRTRKRKQLAEIEEEEKQVEFEEMAPPMSVPPPMSVAPPMSVQPPMSVSQPMEPPLPEQPLGGPMSVGPMSVGPMSVGPMSVGPPQLDDERPMPDHQQAPNMTPFSVDLNLPSVPPEHLTMLEESLRSIPVNERDTSGNLTFPGDMANMGYDDAHPPPTTPGAVSERGAPTPWHEDYDFPVSVGPIEEQATDETFEQFEERVLNKRASQMYHLMKSKLEQAQSRIPFSGFTVRNNRKQVAQKFYSVLMLKKFQVVGLEQESSYAEIYIEKGPNFVNPSL